LLTIINGLSDHNAQRIIISNIPALEQNSITQFCFTQKIAKFSIIDFNTTLNYESWEDIFAGNDVNTFVTIFEYVFKNILLQLSS